jgi:hypothetical protein
MKTTRKIISVAVGTAVIAAGAALTASAAHAATGATTTVTQQVINRPDSGHSGPWAYDNLTRVLAVTDEGVDPSNASLELYTATLTDTGTFTTIQNALTPNQTVVGSKIANVVSGGASGSINYTLTAPVGDALVTPVTLQTEDDSFAAPASANTTGNWPGKAFTNGLTGLSITEGAWAWTYTSGAGEQWADTSVNGDGNLPGDGNITGMLPSTMIPYVLNGKWTARLASTATVTWDESTTGNWETGMNGTQGKCAEVYITGYRFGPLGDYAHAHIGFTCDAGRGSNTGYLRGLDPGHTYALRIVPATGTYGHHAPISGAGTGYVDVFTLAEF